MSVGKESTIMKLWKPLAAIALVPVFAAILAVSGTVVYNFVSDTIETIHEKYPELPPYFKNHPASIQQKASHMLTMSDSQGRPEGVCTGTVIGPHAILTAEHCDKNNVIPKVKIDYSPRVLDIIWVEKDDNEHIILFVDGPEFKDFAPFETRDAKMGEPAYIIGNGERVYPGVYKAGTVIEEYDPSEVDKAAGLSYYTIKAIPGDSGSAVYGLDNVMIGVTTFKRGDEMGGFAIRFDPHVISVAQNFGKGVNYPVEPADKPCVGENAGTEG